MTRRLLRLWLFWIGLVWFVSFPWIGFTSEPQWHRVHYIPFSDPADKARDLLANVLLFLPFGYSITRKYRGAMGLVRAVVLAAVVSACAEAMQLFSTQRHPSATDVTAGVLGALAGGIGARWVHSSSKPSTWTD